MQRIFTLLFALSLFTACGGDNNIGSANADPDAPEPSAFTSGPSCLSDESRSVCDFLDADIVAKYLPDGAEKNGYKDTGKRSMLSSCGYQVEHPTKTRQLEAGTLKMNVPAAYTITISSVRTEKDATTARNRFQGIYRTMSEAEMADAKKRMDEVIDKRTAEGKNSKEVGEAAKSTKSLMGRIIYEPITGIGDLAVWAPAVGKMASPTEGALSVLTGDTYFTITVNTLESQEESKKVALELARAALAKCD